MVTRKAVSVEKVVGHGHRVRISRAIRWLLPTLRFHSHKIFFAILKVGQQRCRWSLVKHTAPPLQREDAVGQAPAPDRDCAPTMDDRGLPAAADSNTLNSSRITVGRQFPSNGSSRQQQF